MIKNNFFVNLDENPTTTSRVTARIDKPPCCFTFIFQEKKKAFDWSSGTTGVCFVAHAQFHFMSSKAAWNAAWVAKRRDEAKEQNKKYCSACGLVVEKTHAYGPCRNRLKCTPVTLPTKPAIEIASLALPSVTITPGLALHPAIVAKMQRSISESLSQYLKSLPVAVAARAVVQGEEALTSAATLLDSQHAQQQLSQLASSSSSSSSSAASTRPVSKEMPETIKIPRTHHRYQTLRRSLVMDCKPPSDSSEIAEVKHSGIQNSDDVFVADSDQDDHDGTDSEIKNPSIVQERIRSNAFEFDQDNESPMGQLIRKTSLDLKSQIKCNRRLDYYH